MARRAAEVDEKSRPLFLWEPVPDLCTPSELENCYEALKHVDVVSPNHQELTAFFGQTGDAGDKVDRPVVEECVGKLLASGIGPDGRGAVVTRAGKEGCLVQTRTSQRWMPAYHQSSEKVVDPTGGGNMFLGGLSVGLVREMFDHGKTLDQAVDEAAIWGTIAASFAIEQVGVPVLSDRGDDEKWNGVRVRQRMDEFKRQQFPC
jgi:sugar/nucleoside kinase (ribokinase family)